MNDLEIYNPNLRLKKVFFFIKENLAQENIKEAFYLKSINEHRNNETLDDLKKIINSDNLIKLVFFKSDQPYNFSRFDKTGIIEVSEIFYDLYLIVDNNNNNYILVIKENNFFIDKPINELAYFKEISNINKLLFFNKKNRFSVI